VIVFDLPGPVMTMAGITSGRATDYWKATRLYLEASQLQVIMRPVAGGAPGAPERTAVTMTADLRPGVRRNVRASQLSAGITGASTSLVTATLLAKGAAVLASSAVLGPALGIGAVLTGLSLYAYRRFYSSYLARAQREMRESLEAIAASIQAEEVFGTLPGTVRPVLPPRAQDDDGSAAVISMLS
jgi:hypothetical protein